MNNTQELPTAVQNYADFEPTPQMQRWFTRAVELKTTSVSKIADSLGIHRNTFYFWLKTPGFRRWWLDMITSYFNTVYLQLIGIGLRMSEKDYRYWHDLLEHVSSRVDFPTTERPRDTVEVMAAAFIRASGQSNRSSDSNQIDNIKS